MNWIIRESMQLWGLTCCPGIVWPLSPSRAAVQPCLPLWALSCTEFFFFFCLNYVLWLYWWQAIYIFGEVLRDIKTFSWATNSTLGSSVPPDVPELRHTAASSSLWSSTPCLWGLRKQGQGQTEPERRAGHREPWKSWRWWRYSGGQAWGHGHHPHLGPSLFLKHWARRGLPNLLKWKQWGPGAAPETL